MGILDFLESIIPGFSGNKNTSQPPQKPTISLDQQMAAGGWRPVPSNSPSVDQQMANAGWKQVTNGMQPTVSSTPITTPSPTTTPQPTNPPQVAPTQGWSSKYQDLYNRYTRSLGVDPSIVKLLVTSENGKENPDFINSNNNGTHDVGLLQVNVPQNDTAKTNMLKDPATNIQTGLNIYRQRLQDLGDPLLALASYNLGAGGAILNPKQALQRAVNIYKNAGLPIPQTAFVKDPIGFVAARMPQYNNLGLIKN